MVFLFLTDGSYVQVNDVSIQVAVEANKRGLPIAGIDPQQIIWITSARMFHIWCNIWDGDPEQVVIV